MKISLPMGLLLECGLIMKNSKEKKCENCGYFNEDRVRCYRFPPQLVIETDQSGNTRNPSKRPSVNDDDWCGEFVPKVSQADEINTSEEIYQSPN